MKKTTKTDKRTLARECAYVAKEMHDAGSQCVHLRDITLKIFGKYAGVKSGAYKDVVGRRKRIRDILEKSLHCHVALVIQKYADDGYPIVTDIDMARAYIPITAGRTDGGVILVFADPGSALFAAYVHVNRQLADQKGVAGSIRLFNAHAAGAVADDAAIDVANRSNVALRSTKVPQIERTVSCRKCSKEVTYSEALRENWFFFKLLDRWTCRRCHIETMSVSRKRIERVK